MSSFWTFGNLSVSITASETPNGSPWRRHMFVPQTLETASIGVTGWAKNESVRTSRVELPQADDLGSQALKSDTFKWTNSRTVFTISWFIFDTIRAKSQILSNIGDVRVYVSVA